jgi:hypothetical protein
LWFTSCASGPRVKAWYADPGEGAAETTAPVAPGGLVYFYIDVPAARPLLEKLSLAGFTAGQNKEALDRTESAVAAIYPEGSERRFLAAARGKYPAFRAGFSFALSRDWKRVRSDTGTYWRSAKNNLSLALSGDRAFISDGNPFIAGLGIEVPEGLAELRRGSLLAGWADDAGPLNQFIASMAIPIQIPAERLLFGVYAAEGGTKYEALLRLTTPTASQARGLVSIFSIARLVIAGMDLNEEGAALASIFFASPPVQEGSTLIIRTGAVDETGIALLLNMFSLYSN